MLRDLVDCVLAASLAASLSGLCHFWLLAAYWRRRCEVLDRSLELVGVELVRTSGRGDLH